MKTTDECYISLTNGRDFPALNDMVTDEGADEYELGTQEALT